MLTNEQLKNLDDIYEEEGGSLNKPRDRMTECLLGNNDAASDPKMRRDSISDIGKENRAYLTWSNVTYYVRHSAPKAADEKQAAGVETSKGLPEQTVREIEGKTYKQIV